MTTTLNIQTVAPYVLTTDRDARTFKTVTTILTDRDALNICAGLTSNFARDLVSAAGRGRLSPNQRVWVHALAMDTLPVSRPTLGNQNTEGFRTVIPATPTATTRPNFAGIVTLFENARAKARAKKQTGANLKIRLSIDGHGIAIKPAPNNGRNTGCLYVTDNGDHDNKTYFGKIDSEGNFSPSYRDCTREQIETITKLLTRFNAEPATFAAQYGKVTNQCCFCGRLLTDDKAGRSVEVGYGPICADNYGLPWG